MKKYLRKTGLAILVSVFIIAIAGYGYMLLPKFGQLPAGKHLEAIAQSPNFQDDSFRNIEPIPRFTANENSSKGWIGYLLTKKERPAPPLPVPAVKTDLKALDINMNIVVWLGHSSFYIQFSGKRLLVDPVFSSYASPIPYSNNAFAGANPYLAADMPDIDFLLITHDHWDHLDYPTVTALGEKIKHIICPLGVGSHFEHWGFPEEKISEGDWNSTVQLTPDTSANILPARHYSGRGLTRNKTLWAAFALISPKQKIYISGDTGYGAHFSAARKTFGTFDLAILDSGQYDQSWRYVHMMPEDAVKAANDLGAKALMPAHIGKFSIAFHSWDDPFNRIQSASNDQNFRLLTPRIGEPVNLHNKEQTFAHWWYSLLNLQANKD